MIENPGNKSGGEDPERRRVTGGTEFDRLVGQL
jgi:hypothetical protein